MIMILGASGYIGSAFVEECLRRETPHIPMSRKNYPYDIKPEIALKLYKPSFVINAAAFIPQPTVDLCKEHINVTTMSNVVFPARLATLCSERGIPMAHISTGCLYDESNEYAEHESLIRIWSDYGGVYAITKWISELAVRNSCHNSYVWRIRLPFDEIDHTRNYLTKLRLFKTVWDQENSLTHRGDFVKSALDMIAKCAPWGTYNMVNQGAVSAMWLAERINGITNENRLQPIKGPVPGCRLSTAKLEATGCGMRPVSEAVSEALEKWRTA